MSNKRVSSARTPGPAARCHRPRHEQPGGETRCPGDETHDQPGPLRRERQRFNPGASDAPRTPVDGWHPSEIPTVRRESLYFGRAIRLVPLLGREGGAFLATHHTGTHTLLGQAYQHPTNE